MTFVLLTGAGFSHNWGGPLASEVFNSVLADHDIDDHTRGLLFASNGAFETVLADLQASTDPNDKRRYDALITSVVGIFNGMNQTFMHMQFEFEALPSVQHSMASFLTRFHAIFTLNQDALIELHYNPMIGGPMNWARLHMPGMRHLPNFRPGGTLHDKFALMEPNPSDNTMPTRVQPYVKLHGAVNWVESGSQLHQNLIASRHSSIELTIAPKCFRGVLLAHPKTVPTIGHASGLVSVGRAGHQHYLLRSFGGVSRVLPTVFAIPN